MTTTKTKPEKGEKAKKPKIDRVPMRLKMSDIIMPPDHLIVRSGKLDTAGLEADIKANKQLQALLVRPAKQEGKYELLAGHRRRKAMKSLGIEDVNVSVAYDLDDDLDALRAVFAENNENSRSNLSPLDQARVFERYHKKIKEEPDAVKKTATAFNCSSEHVRRHLQMLKAPESVKERLEAGTVSKDTVIALQQQSDPGVQKKIAKAISDGRVETASDVKKMAREIADEGGKDETKSAKKTKKGKPDKRAAAVSEKAWLSKKEMNDLYETVLTSYAASVGKIKLKGIKEDKGVADAFRNQLVVFCAMFGWVDSTDTDHPRLTKRLDAEIARIVEESEENAPKSA